MVQHYTSENTGTLYRGLETQEKGNEERCTSDLCFASDTTVMYFSFVIELFLYAESVETLYNDFFSKL